MEIEVDGVCLGNIFWPFFSSVKLNWDGTLLSVFAARCFYVGSGCGAKSSGRGGLVEQFLWNSACDLPVVKRGK